MVYNNEYLKKHLIMQCRYYKGEAEPPKTLPEGYALMWDYEMRWVEWSIEDGEAIQDFKNAAQHYGIEIKRGDDTPLTLKTLLFNRYCHWGNPYHTIEETKEEFERWYVDFYQMWRTNADKEEENTFGFQKEIVDEYHRVEDEQMYYSMGGNTGCLGGRTTPDHISELRENEIFVFGSNKRGAHGAGAAAFAVRKFGAKMGQGDGLQGQSYAISTMEGLLETARNVKRFLRFAEEHQELRFYVTPIGCGIAGYSPLQIAPLFEKALVLPNVFLPRSFWEYIWITEGTGPDFFEPSDEWKKWDR